MSALYMIATPIGNLDDVTLRALKVLGGVDVVFAEDTRVARRLLTAYKIAKPIERYDEHSHRDAVKRITKYLGDGKQIAFLSDAGTPGIQDPGSRLVAHIRKALPDVSIVPVPGPSALTTALSVAGMPADHFEFFGFVPHKKGRKTFFQNIASQAHMCVMFESPHRIEKTLDALVEYLQEDRDILISRELTKIHEEFIRGKPHDIREYFHTHADHIRGEFVIIVEPVK